MDFVSWLVFGILFVLAQAAVRTWYLLAIGFAFLYPAAADYLHAPMSLQLKLLAGGVLIHVLIAYLLGKTGGASSQNRPRNDIGQRVEVLEWLEDGEARVQYDGRTWIAEKARSEMPNADYGIIKTVQYGRLIITTT